MENKIAVCGANSINAITDVIHDYYCGKSDRLSIQLRIQDAIDQLNSVKNHIVSEDGELYNHAQTQQSKVVEVVEALRVEPTGANYTDGYNQALTDLLTKLKNS